MYIIPFTSPEATLENAGGKGANLVRLTRAGFDVPRGIGTWESYIAGGAFSKQHGRDNPVRVECYGLKESSPPFWANQIAFDAQMNAIHKTGGAKEKPESTAARTFFRRA